MRHAKQLSPALLALVAGCVAPTTPPPPRVTAAPPPVRVVPPAPAVTDWRDVPLTPGTWSYAATAQGTVAAYGITGAPLFQMRCDSVHHEVILVRPGTPQPLTIRTSYATHTYPLHTAQDGAVGIVFAARDPALDQIAFSRGRFTVAVPDGAMLVLPAWAEPSRVIEDCRGA